MPEGLDPPQGELQIAPDLTIPLDELHFRYARASGPGGQNVNRSETKVELFFDLALSPSLSLEQRALLQQRLAGALDQEGVLHIFCQSTRSQLRNREEAVARFARLMAEGLHTPRKRSATKPSRAARERRRQDKRARARLKALRRPPSTESD